MKIVTNDTFNYIGQVTKWVFSTSGCGMFQTHENNLLKKRNGAMIKNNYCKPDKITLASWVDKSLDQTLIKKNIMAKFKTTRIWLLNLNTMDEKTNPSSVYTIVNVTRDENDDHISN